MKKIFAAAFALLIFAMPTAAEAQQKKKKQQDETNPLILLIGLFGAGNCVANCTTATQFFTTTTTVTIPQSEGPPIVLTSTSTKAVKKIMSGYVGGALACTFLWPFINHFTGGREPTSEEAALMTLSCWVPGLGIVLYLQNQYAP